MAWHQAIPLALLFFNIGVEIGQLMFVGACLALAWALRQLKVSWPRWAAPLPAYAIGTLAAFWFIERTSGFLDHLEQLREVRTMSTTRPSPTTDVVRRPEVTIWLIAAAAALLPGMAMAHTGVGVIGGFQSGFTSDLRLRPRGGDGCGRPVGAFLGQSAIWLLPVVFPVVMAFGGLAGVLGVPLPGVEMGIALSAVALGAMVALALRPPLWVAAVLVGAFAIFHGHAHGTELPEAANPLAYGVGFVIATGLLHLSGIGLGLLSRWPAGLQAVRIGGGAIACRAVLPGRHPDGHLNRSDRGATPTRGEPWPAALPGARSPAGSPW